jgi:hypothetical protein
MELLEEEEGGVEDHLLLVLGTPVQKSSRRSPATRTVWGEVK